MYRKYGILATRLLYNGIRLNNKILRNNLNNSKRTLWTTSKTNFFERDKKGGYKEQVKVNHVEMAREGIKMIAGEVKKWIEEVKVHLDADIIIVRPGDMDKKWYFKTPEDLELWKTVSDSDHNQGSSECSLSLSPTGNGLFSGTLSTKVPKDGQIKYAGYCNMSSLIEMRSFKREVYLDWTGYSHLELRLRGDGRSYIITISCCGTSDYTWNDVFQYVLYTRGGPHWQLTRIPFSKFYLTSKGRVQDIQDRIPLHRISFLGISAGDKVNAPFRIEIDYIGLYKDYLKPEDFAYEMYQLPKFYAY